MSGEGTQSNSLFEHTENAANSIHIISATSTTQMPPAMTQVAQPGWLHRPAAALPPAHLCTRRKPAG